jgi:hypothetical protein
MSDYKPQSLHAISADAAAQAVLRAEIASQMLAAYVSARSTNWGSINFRKDNNEERAKWAVEQADALMRELSK